MQKKLTRENTTKSEHFSNNFEGALQKVYDYQMFCKTGVGYTEKFNKTPILKEGLLKLHTKLRNTQNSLEEFWKNVTVVWPNSQKLSVYESLIERVAQTEKYVAGMVEMIEDLRILITELETISLEFIRTLTNNQLQNNKTTEILKSEVRKLKYEVSEMREEQLIFQKDKARQYDILMLIFGFQIITVVVCVVLSCCHKTVYIEAKANSETSVMKNINEKSLYLGRLKRRCFSINEY